ncbi:PepSY-associated TM helix domain-containing protein [Aquabacterium sp.]|uniref:PepSY-associated TM helix domain-containing protein n=1 Tax=Aquabacterium sp. TaxID=1872578 RepID=UPI002BBEE9B3|nr:PepSY-associated TM helix domain-containing protein [Aquabacterium sp.]HSW04720.1 PepSY-associated TM helix domain-containing protein [Aquabacterium sp.]
MGATFRKSMAWLHTWSGVVIGGLLFAIFWMGTLSVFDREIDRWMAPMTRLQVPAAAISIDASARPIAERLAATATQWTFVLPNERMPSLRLQWRDAAGKNQSRYFDPATGATLPATGTHGGSGFLYPFHYRLHISFLDIGYWLVGLATMAMLVALVSGVVIHKKIFVEFFTFRPHKQIQRASLDLHNLSSVLALPFHFTIALSGLMIFFAIYFPGGWQAAYDGDRRAFNAEASDTFQRPLAGQPGTLGSLDAMVAQARGAWGGGLVSQVRVHHQGDAGSYVEVRRSIADRVTKNAQTLYFDAGSGAELARSEVKPVKNALNFITGLHEIQFRHWTLRWLYFLAGLSGCVMIATGFLFWLEARRAGHAKKGLAGVRVVEAMTIGSVTGIVIATLAFFVINRLLPLGSSLAGQDRAALEMWVFYLTWLASFGHAAWRRADPATQPARRAWREQCTAIAVLAVAAVLLNALTTGDPLFKTLAQGYWPVAGMDLMLLLGAGLALWTARRVGRSATRRVRAASLHPASATTATESAHRV